VHDGDYLGGLHRFGDLNGCRADAASGAKHQYGVAWSHRGAACQREAILL
jgi:hypothetical protein